MQESRRTKREGEAESGSCGSPAMHIRVTGTTCYEITGALAKKILRGWILRGKTSCLSHSSGPPAPKKQIKYDRGKPSDLG